jgi:tetratricopeptide (TPR) repeat protein
MLPPQSKPEPSGDAAADTDSAAVSERAFPPDSLYPLLVAEFALRQRAYDVALSQYMEQSQLLRDPGLSAHTTHLTQFLQRDEEALQSAQLWVELDPDSIEANHTLAEMLVRRGRNVEAVPLLATVKRQGGNANFPALMNGYGLLGEAQRAELERAITGLSQEFPDDTGMLLTLALIDAENQRFDEALAELDQLFELEPEQPQALLLEARILIEIEARNPYARLERVLQDNPDSKMLRLQYAGLLTATDMNAAREQFEILSQQAPRDADLLFSLALINREIGDNEAASQYLLRAIELGRRHNEAYYYLGRIAEEDGQPEQAIAYYEQVRDGEEYLAACSRVGQIMVAEGDNERRRNWFDEQRASNPEAIAQLYGLEGEILSQAGANDEATAVYDRALEDLPHNTPLRYARAMLHEKRDDLAAMEKDLRAILAVDPDNATALNALGYTLADRTTRYEEALQLITRALQLRPDEPAILDSMGWVKFRTGRYDESLKYLKRAYAEFPDPEVAAHLGEVLWTTGDTEAAREIWRDALQRDPAHSILIGTLNRLGVDVLSLGAGQGADQDSQ